MSKRTIGSFSALFLLAAMLFSFGSADASSSKPKAPPGGDCDLFVQWIPACAGASYKVYVDGTYVALIKGSNWYSARNVRCGAHSVRVNAYGCPRSGDNGDVYNGTVYAD